MKWKFASCFCLVSLLAAGFVYRDRAFAQTSLPPGSNRPNQAEDGPSPFNPPFSDATAQWTYPRPMAAGQLPSNANLFGMSHPAGATHEGSGQIPGYPSGIGGPSHGVRMVPHPREVKRPDGSVQTIYEMRPESYEISSHDDRQRLRDSLSKLRDPKASEPEKKEAREAIEKFLKGEFERDLKSRQEHIERLETQVSTLRKQFDKRQESQAKIIALRMQLLENDAEGLSFPEGFNELRNMNGEGQRYSLPYGQQSNYTQPGYPNNYPSTNGFGVPGLGNPGLGNPGLGNPGFGNPGFGNPGFPINPVGTVPNARISPAQDQRE